MPSVRKTLGLLALTGAAVGAVTIARAGLKKREDVDLEDTGRPGTSVDVHGQRVHFVDVGSGPALVLLHGWSGSTFSMRRTIPDFSGQYRVVAIDLPGYGFSSRDESADYSTPAQAATLLALLEHLGIGRATVLGHSMGGGVAMRLALDAPDRVDRLILVSTVTRREERRARFGGALRPLLPLVSRALLRRNVIARVLRGMVHDPALITPEMIDGYLRPLRVKGHVRSQMKATSDRQLDVGFDPHMITQPTLLLWGEHDRVIPPSAGLALAEELPNARFALIRSAGHLSLEEQPAECVKLIRQFLEHPLEESPTASSNGASATERPSTVS